MSDVNYDAIKKRRINVWLRDTGMNQVIMHYKMWEKYLKHVSEEYDKNPEKFIPYQPPVDMYTEGQEE